MQVQNKGRRLGRYVKDYVVFDLETTGISPNQDDIIEISALRVRDGKVTETFSTLVNPGRHIPARATKVNGITDAMVADAPDISKAMADFLEFIGRDVLVGHNIHTFDMIFVCNAASDALNREVTNDYIDTLMMARSILPQLRYHKLTDVSQHFGIGTEGAHRALNDCIMNQKCYEAMRELAAQKAGTGQDRSASADQAAGEPELSCPVCGSALVKRKGRFGEFYGCSSFPRCRHTQKL